MAAGDALGRSAVCGVDFGTRNPAYATVRWAGDDQDGEFELLSWVKCPLPADGDATQYDREKAALELLLTDASAERVAHYDLELQVPVKRQAGGQVIQQRTDVLEANIRCHGLSRAVGLGLYAANRGRHPAPSVQFGHAANKFKAFGLPCPSGAAQRKAKSVELADRYVSDRLAAAERSGDRARLDRWRAWKRLWEAHRGRTKKESKQDDLADAFVAACARLMRLATTGASKRKQALKRRMTARFLCQAPPPEADGGGDEEPESPPAKAARASEDEEDDVVIVD